MKLPLPEGSADALLLARLAETSRPLVILTETAAEAQRLLEEIQWWAPGRAVHLLPDWETLPYDHFSPHQDLVSERLATLWQFTSGQCDIAVVPMATALYRLPPVSHLAARTFHIRKGERLDLDAFRAQMTTAGYAHVTQVVKPGEYCVRGGLVDLFPMGSAVPFRIDLMDTDVETLRTFDVDTQRTLYPVPEIRLLPAREFPLDEAGRTRFRENFRERFEGDPSRCALYRDVGNGLAPGGVEYYLPLFFEQCDTLFDYLPKAATICLHGDTLAAIQSFWQSTRARWNMLKGDRANPVLDPGELFLTEDQCLALAARHPQVRLQAGLVPDGQAPALATAPLPPVELVRRAEPPIEKLAGFTRDFDGRVLLVAESLGRRETIARMLEEFGYRTQAVDSWEAFAQGQMPVAITAAPVSTGFLLTDERLAVITETELYRTQVRQSRRRDKGGRGSSDTLLKDLSEVRVGDPVVHVDHGIGRLLGLVTLDSGEGATEFLHLQYAGDDTLYVPVSQLHQIGRYTGGPSESAPLHKLGSGQWEKAKRRAATRARDTAAELLDLYARRAARQGFAFPIREHDYDAFAAGFDFEETPDQAAAIQAVMADMRSGKPMDRLICGDVGFGKTEVAMRAAFLAVSAGKQVAILVPTTLLAEQHYQNFCDRFAEWPVKIAELSRFRSGKESEATLEGLRSGAIDIVIGTHKLISDAVRFAQLGLVIIDEEHRFGVRQKERLKALRAEVDVLTLTATPIPRTLALSLEGLRDFSVIATAPQKRLAIKTFVYPQSDSIIREAALRELKRGGQLYFLYNEVETMENMRDHLARILPEARIAVAHGQLRERELERVMREFYHQQSNLLLCSTIIETGIDVPTANTILIHRADRFGLAQLHQLRGRVGRSHHQAYAYLLTPPPDALTQAAQKRLEAIQMTEELGSGFFLAMQDLEIRGAGEVLGDSQSGDIQEVGFGLYTDMLNHAVKALKAGESWDLEAPLDIATEINLHAPALLPSDYCGDIRERLVLYKRLANCDSEEDLDALREELIDRFGLLPEPARVLLECHRLRFASQALGIRKVDATGEQIVVQFGRHTPLEPQDVILLLQAHRDFRLAGPDRLKVLRKGAEPMERATQVRELLGILGAAVRERAPLKP
ncbi:MAG: transcription-repair coupling factor [Betaproteobacteria bacterium]|nr:transcription-repair coupling factor [Betaproteobacteria bacterium]